MLTSINPHQPSPSVITTISSFTTFQCATSTFSIASTLASKLTTITTYFNIRSSIATCKMDCNTETSGREGIQFTSWSNNSHFRVSQRGL